MRASLLLPAGLALAFWSCTPPCEDTSWTPGAVCLRADAGQVVANQAFTVVATSYSGGTCRVVVDGGAITVSIDGQYCSTVTAGSGAAAPRDPAFASMPCEMPALPAGTYFISTSPTPARLTVSATPSADAGLAPCTP